MQQQQDPGARIRRTPEGVEILLSRFLEADRESVWAMLTDTDRLKDWLAPGSLDARPGGRVQLDFSASGTTIDSVVYLCEPPELLEFSWSNGSAPERPLRWVLHPEAEGTRLYLTVRVPHGEDVAKTAAGWDAHLEMLMAALAGVPISFPVARFKQTRQTVAEEIEAGEPSGS